MRIFRFHDFEPASLFLRDHPDEQKKLMRTPLYLDPFSAQIDPKGLRQLFANMEVQLIQEGYSVCSAKRPSDGFLCDPAHPKGGKRYLAVSITGLDERTLAPYLNDPCCQEIWILAQNLEKIGISDKKSHPIARLAARFGL